MALLGVPYLVHMYHLTNADIAREIIRSKKIIPMSHPFWRLRFNTDKFRNAFEDQGLDYNSISKVMRSDKYIVGFLDPAPVGWIKSGLMKSVLNHIQNKSASIEVNTENQEIYSFQIQAEMSRVIVRDHWYVSPEYFIEKYGEDLWKKFLNNPSRNAFDLRIVEGLIKYFNSSINMAVYYGKLTYKAPELWYPDEYQLRPFDGIKRISEKGIGTLKGST